MCGIAGFVNLNGAPADPEVLRRMIGMLRHRGPDESGIYTDGCAGLAHARLSIIDLSGGQQPMPAGSLHITFNGEIFNYVELRGELQLAGHRFRNRSDTEVILHLFQEKGPDCVQRLNGQWAFGIWDSMKRFLFLSRDRMGVRPLFYTLTEHAFIFASEIKAILAHPEVQRELDPEALDELFTFWFTLPPRTMFKDIRELPPGHSLTLSNGTVKIERYWQPEYSTRVGGDERELAEELFSRLLDAVRIRLRSDVPVGAYLSGGLDSTVIAGLIRRHTDTPLKTFSVSFDDREFDESTHQREASRFLDTVHQEVRCSEGDIASVFPEVIWHTEAPVLRTAPAPLFILSRLVRENGYKVVLTGEGSDEILGGYDIFKELKIRRFCAAQPDSRLRPRLLGRLYPYLNNIQAQPDAYLKAFFGINTAETEAMFSSHMPRWQLTSRLKLFFSDGLKEKLRDRDALSDMGRLVPDTYRQWHWFCQAQYLETAHLLPGYLLSSQGDRVAMAHSVEGRYPFLDHRVVDFASSVPPTLKMKVLNEKYLLKRCSAGLVPLSVINRTKQPYRAPEGKCFLQPEAREYVQELLSPERLRSDGIFHPGAVCKLSEKFSLGRAIGIRDNMAMVGIISTQLLLEQFIHKFQERTHSYDCNPARTSGLRH